MPHSDHKLNTITNFGVSTVHSSI